MNSELKHCLITQYETAWMLGEYHLNGLTDDECHWRPATRGLHVTRSGDGRWTADWPEHERYDIGPASIAWLTWHIGFWWSMLLDHSFGAGTLKREQVTWPGSADAAVAWISEMAGQWHNAIRDLPAENWTRSEFSRWPTEGKPFFDIVAWATMELTKNVSEIGYARFAFAGRA